MLRIVRVRRVGRVGPVVAIGALGLVACSSGEGLGGAAEDAGIANEAGDDATSATGSQDGSGDAAISVPPPLDDADTPPSEAGPGGPWVAFVSKRTGNFDLFLIHPDGTGLRSLVVDPSSDLTPAWSPDGAKVVFSSDRTGAFQLYVVDVASSVVTPLATGRSHAISPSWSPDGKTIAFGGDGPGGGLIYLVSAAGGAATALTSGTARDSSPAFAPDGRVIYFASDRSGAFEVWSVKPDGTALTKVTTSAAIVGGPAVSHDGATLALARSGAASGAGSSTAVSTYALASKSFTLFSAHDDSEPAFDAIGVRLAMTTTRYAANNSDVVLVDVDGGAPFRLTDDPAVDGEAAFQP